MWNCGSSSTVCLHCPPMSSTYSVLRNAVAMEHATMVCYGLIVHLCRCQACLSFYFSHVPIILPHSHGTLLQWLRVSLYGSRSDGQFSCLAAKYPYLLGSFLQCLHLSTFQYAIEMHRKRREKIFNQAWQQFRVPLCSHLEIFVSQDWSKAQVQVPACGDQKVCLLAHLK